MQSDRSQCDNPYDPQYKVAVHNVAVHNVQVWRIEYNPATIRTMVLFASAPKEILQLASVSRSSETETHTRIRNHTEAYTFLKQFDLTLPDFLPQTRSPIHSAMGA